MNLTRATLIGGVNFDFKHMKFAGILIFIKQNRYTFFVSYKAAKFSRKMDQNKRLSHFWGKKEQKRGM